MREGLESQFATSRENIINRIPARGGQLNELLAANERARAQAVGTLGLDQAFAEAQADLALRQGLFTQGFNTAFGFPTFSLGGLGSAAASFSAAANRAAGIQQARTDQILSIAGVAAGGGFGGGGGTGGGGGGK